MNQPETTEKRFDFGDLFPNLQAVILCGGLGTRLQSRLPGTPKALAPIAGRPFLEYLISELVAVGIRSIVLCTGHGGSAIREHFGEGEDVGATIQYSKERESLGTGGALKNAQPYIRSNPFLVLNGDTLLEMDYGRLLSKHAKAGAVVTLALTQVADGGRFGNVMLLPGGQVRQLQEKPREYVSNGEPVWIYGGVCCADQRVFSEIKLAPPAVSLERDVFPKLTGSGLFAELFTGFFLDIGIPQDYERACTAIPQRYACAGSHSR
ncbi:MAG TPA: nucleotidyltransferase family protein [Candidatus Acidoferrum sp.]|nr:nucleotidyltransferase family protein [Candidatus Acidoferrum sp.]